MNAMFIKLFCKLKFIISVCVAVNGNWGAWGSWGACLSDCGEGLQRRSRSCDSPSPAQGGRICLTDPLTGLAAVDEQTCDMGACDIGNYMLLFCQNQKGQPYKLQYFEGGNGNNHCNIMLVSYIYTLVV